MKNLMSDVRRPALEAPLRDHESSSLHFEMLLQKLTAEEEAVVERLNRQPPNVAAISAGSN